MTLDEAIKHAEEVVESCERGNPKKRGKAKCAKEHRQLAEWLKDYKKLLEQEPILNKIRSEIEAYQSDAFYPDDVMMSRRMVLEIIDKYEKGE